MTSHERHDEPTMRNHWWWRAGWHVGTRFYTWHLTQAEHPGVADIAERYQRSLAGFPSLDPVPTTWLHMTVQGVGDGSDVDADRLRGVTDAVGERLAALELITTTYQRAHVFGESVVLQPDDPARFAQLRAAIRDGINDARGECPEAPDGFWPHVSVAYSNTDADSAPIRAALDTVEPQQPVQATYSQVSLIEIHRDRRMYEWRTVTHVPLGLAN